MTLTRKIKQCKLTLLDRNRHQNEELDPDSDQHKKNGWRYFSNALSGSAC
jgi:hypothetical protein